jgi:DNA modification methylase
MITLAHGDARTFVPDVPIDCVLTSPPYWGQRDYQAQGQVGADSLQAWLDDLVQITTHLATFLPTYASILLNVADKRLHRGLSLAPQRLAVALAERFTIREQLIWRKANPLPEAVNDRHRDTTEVVLRIVLDHPAYADVHFLRPNPYTVRADGKEPLGTLRPQVLDYTTAGPIALPGAHPAPFPAELVAHLLAAYCPREVCLRCHQPVAALVGRDCPNCQRFVPNQIECECGWKLQRVADPERMADGREAVTGRRNVDGTALRKRSGVLNNDSYVYDQACGCAQPGATRAGCVYDPFVGSGTTALTARAMGLSAVGLDLNPAYLDLAERRLGNTDEARRAARATKNVAGIAHLPIPRDVEALF